MKYLTFTTLFALLLGTNLLLAQQKNVLFIAVDDLKPMLGCYGNKEIKTPNIDKIANSGTVFLNAQCQQAVCSPSRASLMFGLRPDKTKVWDLHTPVRTSITVEKTVAQYFKDNGYETASFGKIFHISMADAEHDSLSWSVKYSAVNDYNYPKEVGEPFAGYYQDPQMKKEMTNLYQSFLTKGLKPGRARAKVLTKIKPSTEKLDVEDNAYGDGQIAQNAIKTIQNLSNKEKPFFIAVGFKKPHLPFVAPKKYWDLYNRSSINLAEWQKAPEAAPSYTLHTWGELKSYSDIEENIEPNGLLNDAKQQELIHGYMASVSYVDAQVGKLLNELENQGVANETIVVLWGDHGWHLGDHGIWCKHSNLEQATRAPLIFSSPSARPNVVCNSPVEFVDIYPTLCDLAALDIPEYIDGTSLKNIINGKTDKVKDFAISQYRRGKDVMGYSLRTERYRYTAWFKINFRNGEKACDTNCVAEELYDYQVDYNETKNLVKEMAYLPIHQDLSSKLLQFLKE